MKRGFRKKRNRKGFLRKSLWTIFGLVIVGIIAGLLFMNFHPVFGGRPTETQKQAYEELENFQDGEFVNEPDLETGMDFSSVAGLIRDGIFAREDRIPRKEVPVAPLDWERINSKEDSLTWFGHSNFLLSIDNKKILIDPVFDDIASPVSFAGSRRFTEDIFHVIEDLPEIDGVFITHDHYDHLDYPSILALKEKTKHFFVPLGVDAHLIRWGIDPENITPMNWWEEVTWEGVTVAAVPARHYSNRRLFERNRTLWAGFVISGENHRVYVSGDSSYGDHFQEIGDTYGPFDLTLIEGGQYDHRWADSHMFPEEAVQAHIDAKGEVMMLMHWGAFSLAFHPWAEPVERALVEAETRDVSIIAPEIGETIGIEDLELSVTPWWDFEGR